MSQENQDALKCAELLEKRKILNIGHGEPCDESATHIRRLVEENEAMLVGLRNRDDWLEQKSKRLIAATALVQQMFGALEASDLATKGKFGDLTFMASSSEKTNAAITAAREWLGQKGETG